MNQMPVDHPVVDFTNHDGAPCQITIGCIHDESVIALFVGTDDNPVIIPMGAVFALVASTKEKLDD